MAFSPAALLSLVDRSERFTCCWLWGGDFVDGTPVFRVDGRVENAVRLVWETVREDLVPVGYGLWPTCGHKTCVNPAHREVLPKAHVLTRRLHQEKARLLALFHAAEAA